MSCWPTSASSRTPGITPIALGGKDKWPGMFWWAYLAMRNGGPDALDAAVYDGAWDSQAFIDAGTQLQALIDLEPYQEGFLAATYPNESAAMGNGKAAMELMGQWAPGAQAGESASKKGIGDDLAWFPFPAVDRRCRPADRRIRRHRRLGDRQGRPAGGRRLREVPRQRGGRQALGRAQ